MFNIDQNGDEHNALKRFHHAVYGKPVRNDGSTVRAESRLCLVRGVVVNAPIAIIRISNLRLRTFVGFNPDERAKQQDVVINIEIRHRARLPALRQDDVASALDYKVITKEIINHVEEGRFLLLEKLASDLLEICHRDPAVVRAVVTVDKPHALRFADSVSLTLGWDENQIQPTSENSNESDARSFSQAS